MIAVPAAGAQAAVNIVVAAGVKAILNFSPGAFKVPRGVKMKNMDLTVSLESLSFFLVQGEARWLRKTDLIVDAVHGRIRMVDVGAQAGHGAGSGRARPHRHLGGGAGADPRRRR